MSEIKQEEVETRVSEEQPEESHVVAEATGVHDDNREDVKVDTNHVATTLVAEEAEKPEFKEQEIHEPNTGDETLQDQATPVGGDNTVAETDPQDPMTTKDNTESAARTQDVTKPETSDVVAEENMTQEDKTQDNAGQNSEPDKQNTIDGTKEPEETAVAEEVDADNSDVKEKSTVDAKIDTHESEEPNQVADPTVQEDTNAETNADDKIETHQLKEPVPIVDPTEKFDANADKIDDGKNETLELKEQDLVNGPIEKVDTNVSEGKEEVKSDEKTETHELHVTGQEDQTQDNSKEDKIKSPPSSPQLQAEDSGDMVIQEQKQIPPTPTQNSEGVINPSTGPQDSPFPKAPPLPNTADKSAVETATKRNSDLFKEEEQSLPLSLNWTFGFNRHIGCLNLSDTTRNLVMYASSHVAVLLDFENNVQKLLMGHANAITCIDCSADKRWLITADKGENSTVIVWDSYTGIPVQTIFDIPVPGGKGTAAAAISSSAKYIVTVSASMPQIVSVWDWTTLADFPKCSIKLPAEFGMQTKVVFCHNDEQQFATNSDNQVVFFSWESGELEYHAPFLSDDVFNRIVGVFSQTLYQLDGVQALTGTSQGNIVVWEPERPKNKAGVETPAIRKRALKLVRLQDRAITTLSFTDGYIIAGDVTGAVKFYDSNLNLYNWHSSSVQMGPITSISFKYDPDFNTELLADSSAYPADATITGNPFIVRDFVVSTKHSEMFSFHADGSSVDAILREHDAAVHAIAVSGTKPWICIGSYAGLLKIWNYETKQCVVTRIFEKGNNIQCLTFDPLGLQIAVGMTNGMVYVVDSISLTDLVEKPFRYARDAVTHIAFSHNSKYLATADADMVTTVFQNDVVEGWKYLGRHRAHYKTIKDLSFGVALDTNFARLLTLGEDRTLVEYNLRESSKDDLRLVSIDRIEQDAVPSCLAWYPDVTKESFLLMANNQYKYKLFNTTTKMCRKTLLAPTYGSHIQKMLTLPADKTNNNDIRLLSYITKYKVGLQILPLDGNPHKSVAVVGHPNGISHLASSHDGKYLFTAGGKDSCVHMWSISANALQAAASLGGEGLTPFYGLLEGGREGELFAELENYFYFAQLRSQGLDTTEAREVSTVIPLEQIPFVMRALGFYPSEQEVEDMLNEVKFSEYVETGQYVSEINLGDFIKLYVNHRPAFGLSPEEIQKAFKMLGRLSGEDGKSIQKQQLFNILQRRGEHMTEHELSSCLGTLLGITSEGGSTELDIDPDSETLGDYLDSLLPDRVSAPMFSEEILGLPVTESQ